MENDWLASNYMQNIVYLKVLAFIFSSKQVSWIILQLIVFAALINNECRHSHMVHNCGYHKNAAKIIKIKKTQNISLYLRAEKKRKENQE